MIFLENEHMHASFAAKGAELQSLRLKKDNFNYLWDGNPDYWGKFSPVLFPIVGGLKNDTYYFEHKAYQLPRHGFARDKNFEVKQISATEIVFILTDDEETLELYPFHFVLQLHYQLSGTVLSCGYEVLNPDQDRPILFSLGAHPAFATPVTNDLAYTDYYLKFNKDDKLVYHKVKHDGIDDETIVIELEDQKLSLSHELFYDDALVIKTLKSDCISLCNRSNLSGIHFRFIDFPFFGIWSSKDANFVCLEPWCGIADGTHHDQQLENKEGILSLAPGACFSRKWEVECF